MTVENINVEAALKRVNDLVAAEKDLSPALKASLDIGGTGRWLHNVSNDCFTCFYPHVKRGCEAIDEMGILPKYSGIICHDHWKPYFRYGGLHALCNAHHLRELERAVEQDEQQWAGRMIALLKEINKATHDAVGRLKTTESEHYRKRYRELLQEAELECPPPDETE